jgi:hypothetical protein
MDGEEYEIEQISMGLSRDPSLAELLRNDQQILTQAFSKYQSTSDDPVHEILQITHNIALLVDRLSTSIPVLVADAMIVSADDIEQRVVLAVRQGSKPVNLDGLIAINVAAAQETTSQLTTQTEILRKIAFKPQKIPHLFYGSVAIVGLMTIFSSAFTWKTVRERVELADWVNTPDGKLARQIVTANKGRLNQQCQQSTRELKTKVVIAGIDRQKICLVAIP